MITHLEEKLRIDRQKEIKRDLDRLGITAHVEQVVEIHPNLVMRGWHHLIGFYTQEDMNLYKLIGRFPEAPFDVRYTICQKI